LKWGGWGSANGQVNLPRGITTDAQGYVYIADTSNNRVQKFDSNGNWILSFGIQGSTNGQFYAPVDVAVDSQGNIYVSDAYNYRIQKLDSNGNFVAKWSTTGVPSGVVVDGSGNVFVAEMSNTYRISKFNSNGSLLTSWNNSSGSGGVLTGPWRVAVDGQGNVYVAEIFPSHRIVKFAPCQLSVNNQPNNTNNFAVFFRNLTIGSAGNDVKQLQALLVNEVGYPADLLTGYFGRITRDAVKRLQEKYGIKPTYGYFGEITRKALSALMYGQ